MSIPPPRAARIAAAVGAAGLAACSGGVHPPAGVRGGPRRSTGTVLAQPAPARSAAPYPLPHPGSAPAGPGTPAAGTGAGPPGGPVAAARRYVAAVWSYTPATYPMAVTAPGLATAALAARSVPSTVVLGQIRTAGQASSVRVTAAGPDPEARSGPSTAYVSVVFTATVSYRGSGSGRPVRHVWALRLTRPGRRWLVDAVLGAD